MLDMVRHADGDITWERHESHNGNITYLPSRRTTAALAERQSDIFDRFTGD